MYPALRREPHYGPNIKRLKGEFSDFYRYRIGDYRLFYSIEEAEVIVVVVDLRSRQDSYRKKWEAGTTSTSSRGSRGGTQ